MIINYLDYLGKDTNLDFRYKHVIETKDFYLNVKYSSSGKFKFVTKYKAGYPASKISSVIIYSRDDLTNPWREIQRYSTDREHDNYGRAIAISDDDEVLVIGAPYMDVGGQANMGGFFVYRWDHTAGIFVYKMGYHNTIEPYAGQYFGIAIDVSPDGKMIFVGATGGNAALERGAIRVFKYDLNKTVSLVTINGAINSIESFRLGSTVVYCPTFNSLLVGDENRNAGVFYHFFVNLETGLLSYAGNFSTTYDGWYVSDAVWDDRAKILYYTRYVKDIPYGRVCACLNAFNYKRQQITLNQTLNLNYPSHLIAVTHDSKLVCSEYAPGEVTWEGRQVIYEGELYINNSSLKYETLNALPVMTENDGVGFYTDSELKDAVTHHNFAPPTDPKQKGVDHFGRYLAMSGDGNYLFVTCQRNRLENDYVYRFKRTRDGWELDYHMGGATTGYNCRPICSNFDGSAIYTAHDNILLGWRWADDKYALVTRTVITELSGSVVLRLSEDEKHLVMTDFTKSVDGVTNSGEIAHLVMDPKTMTVLNRYLIPKQSATISNSHRGISCDLRDGCLAVGRYDDKVEIYKFNEATERFDAAYTMTRTGITGNPPRVDGYHWGYGVAFGDSNRTLYISDSGDENYNSTISAYAVDKNWTQAGNAANITGCLIPDSRIYRNVGDSLFGWATIYDVFTDQLYAATHGVNIRGTHIGAVIHKIDINSVAKTPLEMLRDPFNLDPSVRGRLCTVRLSGNGEYLYYADNGIRMGETVDVGIIWVYKRNPSGTYELMTSVRGANRTANSRFGGYFGVSYDGKVLIAGYLNSDPTKNVEVYELVGSSYEHIQSIPPSGSYWLAHGECLTVVDSTGDLLVIGEVGADVDGSDSGQIRFFKRNRNGVNSEYQLIGTRNSPMPAAGALYGSVGAISESGKYLSVTQNVEGNEKEYRFRTYIMKLRYDAAGALREEMVQYYEFVAANITNEQNRTAFTQSWIGDDYLLLNRSVLHDGISKGGFEIIKRLGDRFELVGNFYSDNIASAWQAAYACYDGSKIAVIDDYQQPETSISVYEVTPATGFVQGDERSLSRIISDYTEGTVSVPLIPVTL